MVMVVIVKMIIDIKTSLVVVMMIAWCECEGNSACFNRKMVMIFMIFERGLHLRR